MPVICGRHQQVPAVRPRMPTGIRGGGLCLKCTERKIKFSVCRGVSVMDTPRVH